MKNVNITIGHAFLSGGRACDLCLTEKLVILTADQNSMLNKRETNCWKPVYTEENTLKFHNRIDGSMHPLIAFWIHIYIFRMFTFLLCTNTRNAMYEMSQSNNLLIYLVIYLHVQSTKYSISS